MRATSVSHLCPSTQPSRTWPAGGTRSQSCGRSARRGRTTRRSEPRPHVASKKTLKTMKHLVATKMNAAGMVHVTTYYTRAHAGALLVANGTAPKSRIVFRRARISLQRTRQSCQSSVLEFHGAPLDSHNEETTTRTTANKQKRRPITNHNYHESGGTPTKITTLKTTNRQCDKQYRQHHQQKK